MADNFADVFDGEETASRPYIDTNRQKRVITLVSTPKILEDRDRSMMLFIKLHRGLEVLELTEDYEGARRIYTRMNRVINYCRSKLRGTRYGR